MTLKVEYPTDEEEFGLVLFAWRGPNANVCYLNVINFFFLFKFVFIQNVG